VRHLIRICINRALLKHHIWNKSRIRQTNKNKIMSPLVYTTAVREVNNLNSNTNYTPAPESSKRNTNTQNIETYPTVWWKWLNLFQQKPLLNISLAGFGTIIPKYGHPGQHLSFNKEQNCLHNFQKETTFSVKNFWCSVFNMAVQKVKLKISSLWLIQSNAATQSHHDPRVEIGF